ncbi:hypothetical protein GJ496_009092 [Pomphorhynchus laevis]|nr:hypothetical protein GJ496_009092 [Pomphorhynchus laevis]
MAGNFWKSSHYKHWLLNEQLISISRSKDCRQFNLTLEEYLCVMNFYADFIQGIGETLRVRQQVIACAIVYFRRFYSKYSLICIDPLLLSPTCILLASKVEEHGGVSNTRLPAVCTQVLKQNRFHSVLRLIEYPYESRHISECEFYLAEVLDCCLIVYHPYRSLPELVSSAILEYLKSKLDNTNAAGQTMLSQSQGKLTNDHRGNNSSLTSIMPEEQKQLEKLVFGSAWAFINDCLRSDVILLNPPHKIAIAAIVVSAANHKINLESWLEQLNLDLSSIFNIIGAVFSINRQIPLDQIMGIIAKVPKPIPYEICDNMQQLQQDTTNLMHSIDSASRQQAMMINHSNQMMTMINVSNHEYHKM